MSSINQFLLRPSRILTFADTKLHYVKCYTVSKKEIVLKVFHAPLLLIFLIRIAFSGIQQHPAVSQAAEHYQTKKFDVVIFPESSHDLFSGTTRFTPAKDEIETAELELVKHLAEINSDRLNQYSTPVIDKNLSKYKRQYFGYVDYNGNKILFINCFWKRDKDSDLNWMNERIRVIDGGSYFWNIKYNINKGELFDLEVNGDV